MLTGYKTYLLAAVAVLYAITAWATGHMDQTTALGSIWAALTAAAMRHGIATTNQAQ